MIDALKKRAREWFGLPDGPIDSATVREAVDTLSALLAQVRNETLEEAAKHCDAQATEADALRHKYTENEMTNAAGAAIAMKRATQLSAHTIRSLKSPG